MVGRPFNSKAFQPVADVGDYLLLQKRGGAPVGGANAFYEVLGVEPLIGLLPHGTVPLWAAAGAAPAGYALDANTNVAANIPAGGAVACTPNVLQADGDEVYQIRWLGDFIGAPNAGVAQDVDVTVAQPGAVSRFGTKNAPRGGVWNQQFQFQLPASAQVKPAQGANMALPAAYAQADAFERAYFTELFVYGLQNAPTFSVRNNGAAAIAGGAYGIQVGGFKFKVRQADTNEGGNWQTRFLLGSEMQTPPPGTWVAIPITGP